MTANPPGACCASGFKHEGTPEGEVKNIDGVDTYIVSPKYSPPPKRAILFLTDIFGIFPDSQLLADEFANSGYLTVIPDLFQGDQIKVADMESGKADLAAWLPNHQTGVVDPVVEKTVKYMRESLGVKKIGAVGYYFGGKYVRRFLKDGRIDVGYSVHSSGATQEELGAIYGPFCIDTAKIDQISSTQLRHEYKRPASQVGPPWQINLFSGVSHGFAVRADLSDKQKVAKEQAFFQAVAWFNQHLASRPFLG